MFVVVVHCTGKMLHYMKTMEDICFFHKGRNLFLFNCTCTDCSIDHFPTHICLNLMNQYYSNKVSYLVQTLCLISAVVIYMQIPYKFCERIFVQIVNLFWINMVLLDMKKWVG